jgi:glycosyltransferase involved in cell wall biosynthesis
MNSRSGPNDVTAVVLTLGEATTDEAIASLARQTSLPRHTIIIRDIVPFHQALNSGAAEVETPFFVQVDADMILDRHCIATLRRNVREDIGIVVGHLRDALIGQLVGIKLFRTECFELARFRDSISPDTDFSDEIAKAGWKTIYVGGDDGKEVGQWRTFGEHRRDYSVDYTYRKFLVEGSRYRYRDAIGGFRSHLRRLARSPHPSALVAQIGLARGIFLEPERDLLGRPHHEVEIGWLNQFLNSTEMAPKSVEMPLKRSANERFHYFYRVGSSLFQDNQIARFRSLIELLDETHDTLAWVSKIACCRGLFAQSIDENSIANDYAILRKFARLPVQLPPIDTSFEAIAAYAAEVGLKSFVIAGSKAAAYQISDDAREPKYQRIESSVPTNRRSGRPRIAPPFRLLGHVVCINLENINSLYWCFDLLRAGYLTLHVPTYLGPRKTTLPSQIISTALTRLRRQRIASDCPGDAKTNSAFKRLAKLRTPRYEPAGNCVLMVAGDLGRGGSERQTLAVASGLLKIGYDVRVVVLKRTAPGQPNFEQHFKNIGLVPQEISDFAGDSSGGFTRIAEVDQAADLQTLLPAFSMEIVQLMAAIRVHRPEIVHAWLDHAGLSAALAATSLGTPSVVIQHGSLSPASSGQHIRLRNYFCQGFRALGRNPTTVLVNNSVSGAADYERWLRLRPGSVKIVRNGFANDTVRLPTKKELASYRSALGLPPNTPVVGTIMRFTEQKDPDLWLTVAAKLAEAAPQVRFIMAGYGQLLAPCKARAEALGIDRKIVFPGAIEDTGPTYALLDVFLLTSKVEGLPNVLIEAQAAGCPVVATEAGGTNEALIDGITGRLVHGRSPDAIAQGVLEVLFDPTWRDRVDKHATPFIQSRFGFERMIEETVRLYQMPLRRSARYAAAGNFSERVLRQSRQSYSGPFECDE